MEEKEAVVSSTVLNVWGIVLLVTIFMGRSLYDDGAPTGVWNGSDDLPVPEQKAI